MKPVSISFSSVASVVCIVVSYVPDFVSNTLFRRISSRSLCLALAYPVSTIASCRIQIVQVSYPDPVVVLDTAVAAAIRNNIAAMVDLRKVYS